MQLTQNLWLLLLVSCTLNFSSFSLVQSLSCVRLFTTNGLKHIRLPCLSPMTGACSNSYPLSWWCLPTISSSVVPFSPWLQSFLASESFLVSQFLVSGGKSIGVSASASVLPMNVQDFFPLRLTGLMSLQTKWISSVFPKFKSINSLVLILLYSPNLTSIRDYWKNHSFE